VYQGRRCFRGRSSRARATGLGAPSASAQDGARRNPDWAEEIAWLSAVDLLARFRAATLSPVDVTESLLGRIEQPDPSGRPLPRHPLDHGMRAHECGI
jgi:hypothetical protein